MLTHSIGYAGLYCFVAGGPYYFIESLGTTPSVYGVIAAIAMSGFLTGSFAARSAIPRWGSAKVIHVSLALMFFPPLVLTGLALAGRCQSRLSSRSSLYSGSAAGFWPLTRRQA